ncbi:MFS transporter [Rhizorhabdus argentea]|uniref:MFS transporter n=1 Tax=Rhizorhabdus argentea TaxID=1387174 RepID=UPI0030ECC548
MPMWQPLPRWLVIAICFLGCNMTMGFAFGSFGPLLVATEQHFGIDRSAAAMGMAFVTLAVGGLAPFLGNIMQIIPVRYAMAAGCLLSAVGYFGLATLNYYPLALLMFVLTGAGISLSGIIGPLTVISRWYADGRGTALSIAELPIFILVTPFIVGGILPHVGRSAILTTVAVIFVAIAPLFLLLRDPPPGRFGPTGDSVAKTSLVMVDAVGSSSALTNRQILSMRPFWLLSLAMGIMSGASLAFYVHIVAFGTSQGMSLLAAGGMLSAYGAAGLFGVLLWGRIADWCGPPQTLALTSFLLTLLWLAMLVVPTGGLYVVAAGLGLCATPMLTLHGAALSALIPSNSASRAMGLSYGIKLPFLFVAAPAIAFIFESTGGYTAPFTVIAAIMALCCILFIALAVTTGQRRHSKTLQELRLELAPSQEVPHAES